ncbi:MAG: hypothetical protein PXX73_04760 [Sideroxydans sp.]|jgi:hypothetical protein|nr:hypothetical protein [Sideroxydans sp.]
MTARHTLTLAQVDELIDQSDRLAAIYDLVLGNDRPGSLMTVDRNNFAALIGPMVQTIARIATSTQPLQ